MADKLAASSRSHVVLWERVDTTGLEYAEIGASPVWIAGEAIVRDFASDWAVSYRIECDHAGVTTRAVARVRRDGVAVERELLQSSTGAWTVDGIPAPQLSACRDADLSITPSTNTLPIRRLRLPIDGSAEV